MNKLINGQSIVDKIVTAKHAITGQDVAKAVLKATTDEVSLPKRKHLDYLVMCTDNPNISVLDMAKLLLDRAQNSHWAIAFKALLTIHNIMNYGSEIFFQHMASNSFSLNFDSFSDTSSAIALHMSRFVRSYANYINSKSVSFRILGFDFCKVKRGNSDSFFRKLETSQLIESLSRLQTQIDYLLAIDAAPRDLSNPIVTAAFTALFKDLVRLFIAYKDGMINLKYKFFDLDKKSCREALVVYKKFVSQVIGIEEFFNLAGETGVEKYDIPKKVQVSPDLLDAFENHLKALESNKKSSLNSSASLAKPGEKSTFPPNRHSSVLEKRTFPTEFEEINDDKSHLPRTDAEWKEIIEDEGRLLNEFKQKSVVEEIKASPRQDVIASATATENVSIRRNRPLSMLSSPKVPPSIRDMPLDSNHNDNSSNSNNNNDAWDAFSSINQTNNLQPPPGFVGSDQILQPTLLHSPPPSLLSLSPPTLDFSKMSLNPSRIAPAMYQFNNLHNHPSYLVPLVPTANGAAFVPSTYGPMMLYPAVQNQPPNQTRLGNPFS